MRNLKKKRARRDTFFINHESNIVPEMSLSYLQSMTICYSSGKYNLPNHSFLEYKSIATQSFSCTIYCVHRKSMFGLVHDTNNLHGFFSALNLTMIFIKPCNNTTFSVSLNEKLFLY